MVIHPGSRTDGSVATTLGAGRAGSAAGVGRGWIAARRSLATFVGAVVGAGVRFAELGGTIGCGFAAAGLCMIGGTAGRAEVRWLSRAWSRASRRGHRFRNDGRLRRWPLRRNMPSTMRDERQRNNCGRHHPSALQISFERDRPPKVCVESLQFFLHLCRQFLSNDCRSSRGWILRLLGEVRSRLRLWWTHRQRQRQRAW